MQQDRYLKGVLTIIAVALVYLCAVLTPWPAASAQKITRPGEIAPNEVVVVGWRTPPGFTLPVTVAQPVSVDVRNTVKVSGSVRIERDTGEVERVVLVGWERGAAANGGRAGGFQALDPGVPTGGLPTVALRQP